jgi:RNA polymerase sigma-70 factor (ECF subfamily)
LACRASANAEDAAQEALSLLFRRIGTIRSLAAISGCLFTVVRRECLRLARRANILPGDVIENAELEHLLFTYSEAGIAARSRGLRAWGAAGQGSGATPRTYR